MKLQAFYERTWQWLQEAVETSLWINKSWYVGFIICFFVTNELSHVNFFSILKIMVKQCENLNRKLKVVNTCCFSTFPVKICEK